MHHGVQKKKLRKEDEVYREYKLHVRDYESVRDQESIKRGEKQKNKK